MVLKKWLPAFMAVTVLTGAALSACSSGNETQSTAKPEGTSAPSATAKAAPADPFGKYDPPVQLTTIRSIDASFKFAEGESLDKNIWHPIFENDYGIKVKNEWVVDAAQFEQKLNVTIASGAIPDFMSVNRVTFQRLIESGMVEDLTQAFEKYASPFVKEMYKKDGGASMKMATVDGKLMGIPATNENGGAAQSNVIWVRTDWLKKLSLPEPKTMADVLKIAEAFANQDPDGNGKKDTVGLGVNNLLWKDPGMLVGFFNGYHAYPGIWVKDSSGNKLVYGSVQPQVKNALQTLRELYSKGVLDKEFAVKPWKKVTEDVVAGKLGLIYGNITDPVLYLKDNRKNDPTADWKPYPIVSADSQPAVPASWEPVQNFYVVKKGVKNPEAVVKLLNIFIKKNLETQYEGKHPFANDPATGIQPSKYAPVIANPVDQNLNVHLSVVEALKKNDGSKLIFPASLHFERITKFRAGDDSMWFGEKVMGPEGSFSIINQYAKEKRFTFDAFLGAPTPTMVEKDATLKKMFDEMATKVIMGAAPLEDFDKFASEWRKLGGEAIEKEVNEWYNKNK